jgi:hypothetical protein
MRHMHIMRRNTKSNSIEGNQLGHVTLSQETSALSNKDTPAVQSEVVIPGVGQVPETPNSLENALTKLSACETTTLKGEKVAPKQTTIPELAQRTDPMPETPETSSSDDKNKLVDLKPIEAPPETPNKQVLSSTQPIPKQLKTS